MCVAIIQEEMECMRNLVLKVNSCFPVVSDILCEFLEVAIHLILYVREVYPSGIFQKRKKYNVPVQVQMNICVVTISTQFSGRRTYLYL